jgi:hypothetical protein
MDRTTYLTGREGFRIVMAVAMASKDVAEYLLGCGCVVVLIRCGTWSMKDGRMVGTKDDDIRNAKVSTVAGTTERACCASQNIQEDQFAAIPLEARGCLGTPELAARNTCYTEPRSVTTDRERRSVVSIESSSYEMTAEYCQYGAYRDLSNTISLVMVFAQLCCVVVCCYGHGNDGGPSTVIQTWCPDSVAPRKG